MSDLPDVPGPPAPFPDGALRLIGQALLEDVGIPVCWSEALAAAGLDPPQGDHGPEDGQLPAVKAVLFRAAMLRDVEGCLGCGAEGTDGPDLWSLCRLALQVATKKTQAAGRTFARRQRHEAGRRRARRCRILQSAVRSGWEAWVGGNLRKGGEQRTELPKRVQVKGEEREGGG